jgi:hypothetical protein
MTDGEKLIYVAPENNARGDDLGPHFDEPFFESVEAAVEHIGWHATQDRLAPALAQLTGYGNPETGDYLTLHLAGVEVPLEFEVAPRADSDSFRNGYVLSRNGGGELCRWLTSLDRDELLIFVEVRDDDLERILGADPRIVLNPIGSGAPATVHFFVHNALDAPVAGAWTSVLIGVVPAYISLQGETIENEVGWRSNDEGPHAELVRAQLEEAVYSTALVDHLIDLYHRYQMRGAEDDGVGEGEAGESVAAPQMVRAIDTADADMPALIAATEALLTEALHVLDTTTPETFPAWIDLDVVCQSLTPQLRAPRPNIRAMTALFGEGVGLLSGVERYASAPSEALLDEAAKLGSEADPEADASHAQAVVQELLDDAVDRLAADDPTSIIEEVMARARQGARDGRAAALDDIEVRVRQLVEGIPGVVVNGAWLSASAIGTYAVQILAADARASAGAALTMIVLRFVLAAYRRRR